MFSPSERNRRLTAAATLMKKENLAGMLMVGNGAVGTNAYGCFRYLADNRVYYHLQAAILVPDAEPVAIAGTLVSQLEFKNRSFIKDCRVAPNILDGIVSVFREKGLVSGTIGVCLDLLPASWFLALRRVFPSLKFIDVTEPVFRLRNLHSAEEIETIRACAKLADAAYQAVCDTVKPGMAEYEVAAALEYAVHQRGGEGNFTLLSSGRFSLTDNKLPCIHAATDKRIQIGDCVAMEITPRFNGYWTQLVRTICVGEPSADLITMHDVGVDVLKKAREDLIPGQPIRQIAARVRKYTEDAGYTFSLPCGHICAIDLNEERLDESNDRVLLPGMAVILHPSILAPNITTGVFWGETFLITENGNERLMDSGDGLMIVKSSDRS